MILYILRKLRPIVPGDEFANRGVIRRMVPEARCFMVPDDQLSPNINLVRTSENSRSPDRTLRHAPRMSETVLTNIELEPIEETFIDP